MDKILLRGALNSLQEGMQDGRHNAYRRMPRTIEISIRKRAAAHLPEGVDNRRVAGGKVLCSSLREALRRPELLHRGALPLSVARARELRARRQLCQVGSRHAPALQRLTVDCRVEALQNTVED